MPALRSSLALAIALLGVGLVFPLAPWSATIASLRWGDWTLAPWLVASCLISAACLLPRVPRSGERWPQGRAVAMGLGVLCLLEPVVHMSLLWWAGSGERASPAQLDLVFPGLLREWSVAEWLRLLIHWVLLPAVAEEWFFRGRLQPWLARRVGNWSAISLATLWFAAVHGQIMTFFIAIPLGIALGVLYLRSGSLYACMLAHAAHNLLFLSLGGLLVARPDLALLFFAGGTWLVLSALPASTLVSRRRRLLVPLLSVALVLGVHASYRWAQELAWLRAAQRLCSHPQVPTAHLLARIGDGKRNGVLSPRRQDRLWEALRTHSYRDDSVRHWLLASIDAPRTVAWHAQGRDGIYGLLRHLSAHPLSLPGLREAALLAAAADPPAFIALVREDPPALTLLTPLAEAEDTLIDILRMSPPRERFALLTACRLAWGQDSAAALHLALPASHIGPRDRHHLYRHHPQAAALIRALEQSDPLRFAAWSGEHGAQTGQEELANPP